MTILQGAAMKKKKIVIALGHEALGSTLPEQQEAAQRTAKAVADFIRDKKDNITGIIVDFTACGRIVYEKSDCTNLSLAYAITTHKSQGSENKRIIYVLSNIMPSMLNCEQVYTAITRAKEYCTVIAQSYALYTAISNREAKEKLTFLSKFLGGEL